jgi:hypothetical protein
MAALQSFINPFSVSADEPGNELMRDASSCLKPSRFAISAHDTTSADALLPGKLVLNKSLLFGVNCL